MSYRCDKCNAVRYGNQLNRVSEIRNVNYNRGFNRFNRREKIEEFMFDLSFTGTEYVSVEKLCDSCYDKFGDNPPRISNDVKDVSFIGVKHKKKAEVGADDEQSLDVAEIKAKYERGN